MTDFNRLYNDLKSGAIYGEMLENVKYPCFWAVLYLTPYNNFGWRHNGSSANPATKEGLQWILTHIFKMTATEFLNKYHTEEG